MLGHYKFVTLAKVIMVAADMAFSRNDRSNVIVDLVKILNDLIRGFEGATGAMKNQIELFAFEPVDG